MKFRDFLTEKVSGKVIVVYGGGFQPFHQGHMSSYVESKQKFPRADYYVASSSDVKLRPIPFKDKKFLAQQAGVVDNFVQVVQPVNPQEIIAHYNENKDILILVRSEKDPVKYTKKDGSPAYYQPFVSIDKCEPFKNHAYIFVTKKKTFYVAGKQSDSGSQIRQRYSAGDDKIRRQMISDLYPKAKNPAKVKQLLDKYLTVKEDVDFDFEELLTEGVHDQSIFKAVFLAGGPGSGKDYVLDNTLQGHGLTEINLDKAIEFLGSKKGVDDIDSKAKNTTELRQKLALKGRNGVIINGTGDDLVKVQSIKQDLEELGYDTSMIMVNTSDEVSAQRNIERGQRGGRTVPETVRKEKWDSAQNSRTEYAKMFGANYMEFDNSEDLRNAPPEVVKQKKDEMLQLFTNVKNFVSTPPSSEQASMWVAHQLDVKDTLPVKKDGPEMMPHPESNAAEEAKKLGLQYYGFGRYGQNGEVTHRSVHDKLVEIRKQVKENIDEDSLDEFVTISSYSKKELDKPLIKFKKIKDRYRKLIRTPLSDEFDVYYLDVGGFHEYVFTERGTEEAVGSFEIEMPWGNTRRPKVVKPGVRIVTPHLSFIPKYQGKGLAKKTYLAFLRMKNYVFETDRHTKEAAILWNSLAKERDIVTFYYDKDTGKISKTEMNTNDEVKYLGLKSDFNLPKGIKEDIDIEFEELFSEDLRNWFSKSHPEGDWKRINTKGEVVGPCAREPGEPKPKCMSRAKRESLTKKERAAAVRAKRKHDPNPERKGDPINVSNFGKGKISESYSLSDSSAMNLLLLGSDIDEQNLYYNGENDNYDFSEETKRVKLMRDKAGKIRTFMLRRAAAKEAHTHNGVVMKYKNGYVIKLHEENDDVRISEESIQTKTTSQWRETSARCIDSSRGEKILNEGVAELTSGQEYASGTGIETTPTQASGQGKITLQQIRQRKTQKEANDTDSTSFDKSTQINEIDKGIEPGLSMATGGENATRLAPKNKAVKKPFEETIGAGGEMATSMSDNEELKLKRKGIDLQSFKSKRPIG
jgi:hypothetical protein